MEVKAAAYLQSWQQKGQSKICFGIRPTFDWDAETNVFGSERRRQANVDVFYLLKHTEKATWVGADDGAVNEQVLEVRLLGAELVGTCENAGLGPEGEAL